MSDKKIILAGKDSSPLTKEQCQSLFEEFPESLFGWEIISDDEQRVLQKTYVFKNFSTALAFTNAIGDLAETENHHPTLMTQWGSVTVDWWTHTLNGLHMNDFIMAARCETLYSKV